MLPNEISQTLRRPMAWLGVLLRSGTRERFGGRRKAHAFRYGIGLGLSWVGVGSLVAAELTLAVELRRGGAALAVSGMGSEVTTTVPGQRVNVTRVAMLISEVALVRAAGGTVQLPGQFGFLDAESGRMSVALSGVPEGEYAGLEFSVGVPVETNHADPGRWAAGHALNPLVNGLHWGWQGGFVFLALEGKWRNGVDAKGRVGATEAERGFSYHVATDARRMAVRFRADYRVAGATTVKLALDVARVLRDVTIRADDGSESTHSAEGDALAVGLSAAVERAWFFIEAKPTDGGRERPQAELTAGGGERAQAERPAHRLAGARRHEGGLTPLPFVVPAGFPQPELPADNPLTQEGVALGELLFNDRRLSAGSRQSCASCHAPERAFSDGQATSAGVDGLRGPRNSMPLFNLAWSPAYAWDGGKPRIRDQVRAAMTNPIEMKADLAVVVAALNRDAGLRGKFAAAFGSPEITADRVDLAIEQFLLTLVAADSKFDRSLRGTEHLTEEEQQGFALFVTEYDPARGRRGADCFHCHGGALFTDFGLRSNGLDVASADAGRALVTGKPTDAGKFKTPSLRNVAVTAPYMHDGRFGTLEEVVAHYDHGVKRAPTLDPNLAKHPDAGLALTPAEQRALVAFLRTLTDSSATVFPGDTSRTTFP
jgi:cytochrome c peroxidase